MLTCLPVRFSYAVFLTSFSYTYTFLCLLLALLWAPSCAFLAFICGHMTIVLNSSLCTLAFGCWHLTVFHLFAVAICSRHRSYGRNTAAPFWEARAQFNACPCLHFWTQKLPHLLPLENWYSAIELLNNVACAGLWIFCAESIWKSEQSWFSLMAGT